MVLPIVTYKTQHTHRNKMDRERWGMLDVFVRKVCADRDESHGYEHMKTVAETTRAIVQQDFLDTDEELMIDAITVAWLHDIADPKYDKDGKLSEMLVEWGTPRIENFHLVLKTIHLVSFRTENKAILAGTPLNYEDLLGKHFATVRQIVSDADKLEAIGKIGVDRCLQYTIHANPGHTEEQIIAAVKKHAEEKLKRLADEFIRTPTGKKIASLKHSELLQALADL